MQGLQPAEAEAWQAVQRLRSRRKAVLVTCSLGPLPAAKTRSPAGLAAMHPPETCTLPPGSLPPARSEVFFYHTRSSNFMRAFQLFSRGSSANKTWHITGTATESRTVHLDRTHVPTWQGVCSYKPDIPSRTLLQRLVSLLQPWPVLTHLHQTQTQTNSYICRSKRCCSGLEASLSHRRISQDTKKHHASIKLRQPTLPTQATSP